MGVYADGGLGIPNFLVFFGIFGPFFGILGQFWARIRTPRDFLGQVDPFSAPTDPRRRVWGQNKIPKTCDFKPPIGVDPHRRFSDVGALAIPGNQYPPIGQW